MMRWIVLVLLFVLYMINFADKSVIGYAAVPMMKELHLTPTQFGLIGSSFFWLYSIMSMFGGALSDRFGTKKLLLAMALSWTVIQFGASFSSSLYALIISRVLLGAFEGPFYAIAVSHLSKWFSKESRGTAISTIQMGGTIGAYVTAPVLVFIIERSGWRSAFIFLAIISLIWFVLWIFIGKENPKVNLVDRESNSPAPKFTWSEISSVILNRTFIFTCLITFGSYWLVAWGTVWFPSFLVKAIQMSPTEMSYATVIKGLGSALLTILICQFADRLLKRHQAFKKAHVPVAGIGLLLAALFFYSVTIFHSPVWVILAMLVASAFANSIFVLGAQIVNNLLPERSGFLTGTLIGFASLAGIVGPLISGSLIELAGTNVTLGYNYNILFIATLLLVSGALMLLFVKPDVSAKSYNQPIENSSVK
ncbi:MFS transporter [Peribacillus frigoritolerans]|uniref:MFS transporter n=1 Tax=Peribacillus frigoritolerans TaxID=450367 RepID=UPI0037F6AD2A